VADHVHEYGALPPALTLTTAEHGVPSVQSHVQPFHESAGSCGGTPMTVSAMFLKTDRCVGSVESVALMLNEYRPGGPVGVPEISPVFGFSVRPPGGNPVKV
jgi:hypothetical protein